MDLLVDVLDPPLFDPFYSRIKDLVTDYVCLVDSPEGIWEISDREIPYAAALRHGICDIIESTSFWDRQSIVRQYLSAMAITMVLSTLFFFICGSICYYLYFDPAFKSHPKFLKNQVRQEIQESMLSILFVSIFTAPIFVAQFRGYSKLYASPEAGPGDWYEIVQFPLFVIFSDTGMYWLHRMFHLPLLFNTMHKGHHRYIIPTPFSAYAFHPVEAYIMSLPAHAYCFALPMSKFAYIVTFVVTNIWSFLLHDNSDAFHTVHHKNVKFNFGQFLHSWDRLGGTYQDPVRFFSPRRSGQSIKQPE
ncbi:hypothetical protein MW887_003086 [Aspergillus wentii]|nr:hypothetical protein MW887_003086 [Aspergillus wentii]